MKHSHKLHGAIVTGILTFVFLTIDFGIYMGTGKSRLVDFTSGLKMLIVRKTHYVTKYQKISNQLDTIEVKIDDLTKKFDEHEIQHHQKTRAEVSMENLHNAMNRKEPEVTRTEITEASMDTEKLKVDELRGKKINVFENLPKTLGKETDVSQIIQKNPKVDFNTPFLAIRKFNSQKEADAFHKKSIKGDINIEDETNAKTQVFNLKDVMNNAKNNDTKNALGPFGGMLNQVGMMEEIHQEKNAVIFHNPTKNPMENISEKQREADPAKSDLRIITPKKPVVPESHKKFVRPTVDEIKNANTINQQFQAAQRLRMRTAFKKARAQMFEAQIIQQQKMLRKQRRAMEREMMRKNREMAVFNKLREENKAIANTNKEVIDMSQVLLKNIERAAEKLEKTEEKLKRETEKFDEMVKRNKAMEKARRKRNVKKSEETKRPEEKFTKEVLKKVEQDAKNELNEDDRLLNQLEEAKKEIAAKETLRKIAQ